MNILNKFEEGEISWLIINCHGERILQASFVSKKKEGKIVIKSINDRYEVCESYPYSDGFVFTTLASFPKENTVILED